jgi:hypothetical protein
MKIKQHISSTKQIFAVLMLAALFVIVSFSFATMMHNSGESMQGGCPFTAMGAPVCPQNLAAAAVHHISAYQSIFSAPQVSGIIVLMIALLILAYRVLLFSVRPPVPQSGLTQYQHYSPDTPARGRENIRWLSLFEHSPSLI